MTTESRLGVVEGRTAEHAAAIAALRDDMRQGFADVRTEIRAVNARIDALDSQVNARIDRLILALWGVGAALVLGQAGVIITVVLRT